MNKKDVIDFFDRCATWWDSDMIRNEEVIAVIMNNAGVCEGSRVLDVACGTGVLIPDYLSRGVTDLTAIDISPEMVRVAKEKFPQIDIICGDVEEMVPEELFDVIMVYNAFPHFPKPKRLLEKLANMLKAGGRLSIAHGMSREAVKAIHSGSAKNISIELPEVEELAELLSRWLTVETVISDERMYQVVGRRD